MGNIRLRCYEKLQVDSPKDVMDGLDRLAKQFSLAVERSFGSGNSDQDDHQPSIESN